MRGSRRAEELISMKERRRRDLAAGSAKFLISPTSSSFRLAVFLFLFSALALSTFRLFPVSSRPVLLATWRSPAMNAVSGEHPLSLRNNNYRSSSLSSPAMIEKAISFPDHILLFMKPQSIRSQSSDLRCTYFVSQFAESHLSLPAISSGSSFVRCPIPPGSYSFNISLSLIPFPQHPPVLPHQSDHLAYTAVLDPVDNSTVVFAKGHNLRPARLSNPSSFECIFGWDFSHPKYSLSSEVLSAAQEIFRCRTPLSVLQPRRHLPSNSPLVTVRFRAHGSAPLPSVARPEPLSFSPAVPPRKRHLMCVCTMIHNQAKFLREWIIYHSRIGVERWFIYDNNSDDDLGETVEWLSSKWNLAISLHDWPWVKTQEAGFAHCALRARDSCKWVGFIDVDEFLYLPSSPDIKLGRLLRNFSRSPWVAELRTACHSFGPSGRKAAPAEGVMIGYGCRISPPERHKSIIRPEALNPSLINVVHHFHLKDGMKYVNLDTRTMVINHYKYQVWEVFKEKFYRRVATYVADWQEDENAGSKDRAPGLGTKAVEPSDWANRFCEVNDTGLRDWVLKTFVDPNTGRLPW